MTLPDEQSKTGSKPRYRWPWFVAAAVLLGILLSVLWMAGEIQRARRIRDANSPPQQTNTSSPLGRH